MDIWISIVVTFVLVLVNGYFSMSEMALVNARHVLLQHDADEGDKSAQRALGLAVQRRMGPDDGSWENVFLGNEKTDFQVELTWNRGRTEPLRQRRTRHAPGLRGGRHGRRARLTRGDGLRVLRERAHGHLLHRGSPTAAGWKSSQQIARSSLPHPSRNIEASQPPHSPTILMTTGGIRARRCRRTFETRWNIRQRTGKPRWKRLHETWKPRWKRVAVALDSKVLRAGRTPSKRRPGRYHGSTVNCSGAAIGETGNGHGSAPLQTVRNATGGKHPTRPPVA